MRLWQYIVIHHSATKDSGTVSWSAIRQYHVQTKGWKDVGYHWGAELVNGFHEILRGRSSEMDGAHCKESGMNHQGVGVCVVGDFDPAVPPAGQMAVVTEFVRWLMGIYEIPASRVIGHREAGMMAGFDWQKGQYKSCPGKQFDMQAFRAHLAGT